MVQDGDGSFIIDQAKVTPEAREDLGLSEVGLIYADKPGFSWYDLVDFGGEAGPEILGGIAVSALVAGTGGGFLPVLGAMARLVRVQPQEELLMKLSNTCRDTINNL